MKTRETINIIGAGPAGLTAAIILRKHGFHVKVFEQSSDVGHRSNGDFQGLENWSSERDITEIIKDTGIEINFLCVPRYEGTLFALDMKPAVIKSDKPIFYLVQRGPMAGTLDAGLKEQALSMGVEIFFNRRLDTFNEKAIVGTGSKGADVIAVGSTFNTEMKNSTIVIINDSFAPKGYAYLLVNNGYGTMATVLYREYRRGDEYFEKMKRFIKDNVELDIKNEKKFGGYGNYYLRDTQIHNNKFYIGEAAGFQDGLWGFGMKYAILSGYLAAKSFIDGSDYDVLWKRDLKPMIETSIVNRYLFEKFSSVGYRYIAKKAGKGNPCDFLGKHYNSSLVKRLLLPVAKRKYKSRVKDKNCNHEDCSCVWCRCGEKAFT